jgi:hypothetical protein
MSEGKKFDDKKLRVDLVPPEVMEYLAPIYEYGVNKYGFENWKKSFDNENQNGRDRLYAAALRHLFAWKKGNEIDEESGFSHLQHAIWNCFTLLWHIKNPRK